MITWNKPDSVTKTTIETHAVNLPFLGGRVEVVHTDASGARMERPQIHMYAEAVDCDWRIILQGDAGTQADAGLMPQNVHAMDKDFHLVFADGRRFELLTQKREPITDAAAAARALHLERIKRPTRDAAMIEAVNSREPKPSPGCAVGPANSGFASRTLRTTRTVSRTNPGTGAGIHEF